MLVFEESTVPVERKLKILVYGGPGTGKTWFSLHAPAPLVIDTESSTDAYRGRVDMPKFIVSKSAKPTEIVTALETIQRQGYIQQGDKRIEPETIVLDSFSVLWSVAQESGQKAAERRAIAKKQEPESARLAFGDWGLIKRPVQRLYTQLVNMPHHVIITARAKDIYENNGGESKKIGEAPDLEKNAPYVFDLVIHLILENGKRIGIIEKSRFADMPPGKRIDNPTWANFAHLTMSGSASGAMPDQDKAAEEEAEVTTTRAAWTLDVKRVTDAEKYLVSKGINFTDASAAVDLDDWHMTSLGPKEFLKAIDDYIDSQLSEEPIEPIHSIDVQQ